VRTKRTDQSALCPGMTCRITRSTLCRRSIPVTLLPAYWNRVRALLAGRLSLSLSGIMSAASITVLPMAGDWWPIVLSGEEKAEIHRMMTVNHAPPDTICISPPLWQTPGWLVLPLAPAGNGCRNQGSAEMAGRRVGQT
jgi:hypothetical protein